MKLKRLLVLLILLFGFQNLCLAANKLEDIANNYFDEFVSSGGGGTYIPGDAQRNGVFSGGNYSYRTKMYNANLLSVTPPSFKSGCNGIDFNFGSFSFISKEQLKNLMKGVVAAAPTYAFGLAVDALCSACFTLMEGLAKKVNEIGKSLKNSCEIAKAMVHTGDSLSAKINGTSLLTGLKNNDRLTESTVQGWFDGTGDNKDNLLSKSWDVGAALFPQDDTAAVTSAAAVPPETKAICNPTGREKLQRNTTWAALKDNDFLTWFSSMADISTTQTKEKEILMSLLGTTTITIDETPAVYGSACEAATPQKTAKDIPPIIEWDQFVIGNDAVSYYECDDLPTTGHCLHPKNTGTTKIPSMEDKFLEILDEIDTSAIKFHSTEGMDAAVLNFAKVDRFYVLARVRQAGAHNYKTIIQDLRNNANLMVTEMVYESLSQLLSALRISLTAQQAGTINIDNAITAVTTREKELYEWYSKKKPKIDLFREHLESQLSIVTAYKR